MTNARGARHTAALPGGPTAHAGIAEPLLCNVFDQSVAGHVNLLLARRKPDGGWPYRRGSSRTEPTAFALMALASAGYSGPELEVAFQWIRRAQNADGGWPVAPGIGESCWVTNAALLSLANRDLSSPAGAKGLNWVLTQTSADQGALVRLIRFFSGSPNENEWAGGAPWLPGTAAWVSPTCMMLLLLQRAEKLTGDARFRDRMTTARQYLLGRRLPDGGWNHGGFYAPGEPVTSYPEATGQALLALAGCASATVQASVQLANRMMLGQASASGTSTRSAEAWSWLTLGLFAQGAAKEEVHSETLHCWTTLDLALLLLARTMHLESNRFTGASHA